MVDYIHELTRIFQTAPSKEAAHSRSESVLLDMVADPGVLTTALRRRIEAPGGLTSRHFPVIGFPIAANSEFVLEMNCFLPLPDNATGISMQAIHHHGTMLMTTASTFGPGYEHWMFETPTPVNPERALFESRVIEHGPHAVGHVAFVDAYVAHVLLYPKTLSITLALWSSRDQTTWRDHLKRMHWIRRHAQTLRKLGNRLGLTEALQFNNMEFADFYPTDEGLVGLRERFGYPLGPTGDYLTSLFHVLQQTGNDDLAREIEQQSRNSRTSNPAEMTMVETLLRQIHTGEQILPRLSEGHFDVPTVNFSRAAIIQAVPFNGDLEEGLGS